MIYTRIMSNKPRVFVSFYHRDELSLGENRKRLGSASYHWAILVAPKGAQKAKTAVCEAYEVTNSAMPDSIRRVDLNPQRNWSFLHRVVDAMKSSKILCMIMIGKVPNATNPSELTNALEQLALPSQQIQGQGCLWWTMQAVRQLQAMGFAEKFDVQILEDEGTKYPDERLKEIQSIPFKAGSLAVYNLTNRPL